MTAREEISLRRAVLAAALVEYRAFGHANPGDPLAAELATVTAGVRARLRERRAVMRAIGWAEKVTA